MKTVVVGILNIDDNNNFMTLPVRWKSKINKGVEIIVHTKPAAIAEGREYKTNYDVLIDLSYGKHAGNRLTISAPFCVSVNRLSKGEQHLRLSDISKKHKIEGLVVPTQYDCNINTGWLSGLEEGVERILLKDPNGARGIGQVLMVRSEEGTLHGLVADFFHFISQSGSKRVEETKEIGGNDFRKEVSNDGKEFTGFSSRHGWAYNLGGMENTPGESESAIGRNYHSLEAYGVVEGIEEEYRVWTDYHCKPFVVGKRNLIERCGGVRQAGYISEIQDVNIIPEEALRLFELLELRQQSIDLFKLSDGRWGLFEWQPQSGISSVSHSVVKEWHVSFIENAVNEYITTRN